MSALQYWRSKPDRLAPFLDQAWVLPTIMWCIPLMFGLLSMKLGQDANWDLLNYHLYNPFSFFNNKLGVDLAPAQMQTYFNPTIDFLYYGMVQILPSPVVSFGMGLLHGLNFNLLTVIARALLPVAKGGMRVFMPIIFAFAGMCSNAFLSEFGNTMGDNLVALAVLGALAILLHHWHRLISGGNIAILLSAGFLMGIGVGLKLTAAVFAPAMCISLLILPIHPLLRIRSALLFGLGVLIGISIAGGHWYWKMWVMFGNPLFPQFNSIFQSPMAGPMSLGDTRFLPHSLFEYIFWPIIFVLDPVRVSEIKIASPIWAVLFLASAALLLKNVLKYRFFVPVPQLAIELPTGKVAAISIFFGFSYLTWMILFSIYRYLVPIELLAPLILWLCAKTLLPRIFAGKIVAFLMIFIIASNFFPRSNWGYVPLASTHMRAEVPTLKEPSQSIVFTVHHNAPMSWLITQFPKDLAFVALGSNFPESEAYRKKVINMMVERRGPMYTIFDVIGAHPDKNMDDKIRARNEANYRILLKGAVDILYARGLHLDPTSCIVRSAYIGNLLHPYNMCRVYPTDTPNKVLDVHPKK